MHGYCKNFQQLLGPPSLLWFLPIEPSGRTTDGVNYPYPEDNLATELIGPFNIKSII